MQGGLILGSARCGSTLVSRILRLHPDVLSLSELFATAGPRAFRPARPTGARFWRGLATPSRALSAVGNPDAAPDEFLYGAVRDPAHDPHACPPILGITLPHLTDDPDALFAALGPEMRARGRAPLADHYRALFAALARREGGRVWVERSGGSLVAAGTLAAMFPEARRVMLYREGPATALSMRDFAATRVAIWTWRHLGRVGIDLLHAERHYGRGAVWPLVAAAGGLGALRRIAARRPTLTECGAFWSAVMVRGLRALGDVPVIRYEALCRAPGPEIARLGLALTGRAPEDWVAAAASLPSVRPSRVEALTAAERAELDAACAPGERAFAAWDRGRRPEAGR